MRKHVSIVVDAIIASDFATGRGNEDVGMMIWSVARTFRNGGIAVVPDVAQLPNI